MDVDLRQVQVSGSMFHGRNAAKRLGFTWCNNRPRGPYRYFISCFNPGRVNVFMSGAAVAVVHWIGTDVSMAVADKHHRSFGDKVIHWCDSWNLRKELATIGIDAEVLINPPTYRFTEGMPRTTGDAVLLYVPSGHDAFFHAGTVKKAAELAGREVVILPREQIRGGTQNDITDVFEKCSHYVRLAKHDGFSHMAAEMMMAGRVVITNQDRPYQVRIRPTVSEVVAHLDDKPHREAADYYRRITDPENIRNAWRWLINEYG
jgi:hypothetical protein